MNAAMNMHANDGNGNEYTAGRLRAEGKGKSEGKARARRGGSWMHGIIPRQERGEGIGSELELVQGLGY